MGTEANVFINIIGAKKKKATGKMPLQLMNKSKFEPASVETFSIEAPDVEDVHKVEVSVVEVKYSRIFGRGGWRERGWEGRVRRSCLMPRAYVAVRLSAF